VLIFLLFASPLFAFSHTGEVAAMVGKSKPVIEFKEVYKVFVSGDKKNLTTLLALKNADFSVPEGEFLTIVGPSGCGKSTVLNLVGGFMEPSSGVVLYKGKAIKGINTQVGYVTQDDNLLPWRTVQKNIEFSLETRGVSKNERKERASEHLRRVGLEGFERHYPHELSGGMRKRVAIARTLVYEPDVILMDEPFGPLDAQTRLILQDQLLKLWANSRQTVIFITHDLVESIVLSNRVMVMSSSPGRIKNIHTVSIPHPRDVFHIHEVEGFSEIYEQIWQDIREELLSQVWSEQGEAMVDG
jgi:NitT/TauT family transport system ATP-binding protein